MAADPDPVTLEESQAALRAHAFTQRDEEDGSEKLRIHTFAGGGGIALGADWDLDEALEFARAADERLWVDGLAHHDLAIRSDGRVIMFDVPRPKGEDPKPEDGEEPFDAYTSGGLVGLGAFAWMKDGTYYVGTTGTTLRAARRHFLDERGYEGVPDPYYAKLIR